MEALNTTQPQVLFLLKIIQLYPIIPAIDNDQISFMK